ncbi:unnamed protein product [Blepharisma stoltei]|uniref:Uncharacterized protein n=1 Tax=Blepharisma stoltei TaxID=1481888 RepID=A0AAU9IP08_9CILI|nr:unnamed protein product [Blepharisma stoltei]
MARRDSNIIEIKLERIGKKRFDSELNGELKSLPGHPVSISSQWPIPNELSTPDYQISPSFGKMYVGESFTCCLRISNISQGVTLERVIIACQLKYTNVKNIPMLFQTEIQKLQADQTKRFAFSLQVDRPDTYYLSFAITFNLKDLPEPINVGKLFKFEAKNPLEMSNTIFKAENGFIVQCRVSNTTIYPMHLNSVELLSNKQLFTVIPLHEQPKADMFNCGEIRSYLYHLVESVQLSSFVDLGVLSITWHNTTGDFGHLESQPLTYTFKMDKILKLAIDNKPKNFELEMPVQVNLIISNISSTFMLDNARIELQDSLMKNVDLYSMSSTALGKILPLESKSVTMALFPKVPGIQILEGIKIYSGTNTCEFEPCQIYVKP